MADGGETRIHEKDRGHRTMTCRCNCNSFVVSGLSRGELGDNRPANALTKKRVCPTDITRSSILRKCNQTGDANQVL